jgi:hypothetical protein
MVLQSDHLWAPALVQRVPSTWRIIASIRMQPYTMKTQSIMIHSLLLGSWQHHSQCAKGWPAAPACSVQSVTWPWPLMTWCSGRLNTVRIGWVSWREWQQLVEMRNAGLPPTSQHKWNHCSLLKTKAHLSLLRTSTTRVNWENVGHSLYSKFTGN